jgi:hypothetical protein
MGTVELGIIHYQILRRRHLVPRLLKLWMALNSSFNVLSAAKLSHRRRVWSSIPEYTVDWNHTLVTYVTNHLHGYIIGTHTDLGIHWSVCLHVIFATDHSALKAICSVTNVFILGINDIVAMSVKSHFSGLIHWRNTILCIRKKDHTPVMCVTSPSRTLVHWRIMYFCIVARDPILVTHVRNPSQQSQTWYHTWVFIQRNGSMCVTYVIKRFVLRLISGNMDLSIALIDHSRAMFVRELLLRFLSSSFIRRFIHVYTCILVMCVEGRSLYFILWRVIFLHIQVIDSTCVIFVRSHFIIILHLRIIWFVTLGSDHSLVMFVRSHSRLSVALSVTNLYILQNKKGFVLQVKVVKVFL